MNHTKLEVTAQATGAYGLRFLGHWQGATKRTREAAEAKARQAAKDHLAAHPHDRAALAFVARPRYADPILWSEEVR